MHNMKSDPHSAERHSAFTQDALRLPAEGVKFDLPQVAAVLPTCSRRVADKRTTVPNLCVVCFNVQPEPSSLPPPQFCCGANREPPVRHGKHFWQPAQEPHRQEGDEDPHGGPGCCREDHHSVQAQAGRDRHHHSHNWCVGKQFVTTRQVVTKFLRD